MKTQKYPIKQQHLSRVRRIFNFSSLASGEGPPADLEQEQSRGLWVSPTLSPRSTPVGALSASRARLSRGPVQVLPRQ